MVRELMEFMQKYEFAEGEDRKLIGEVIESLRKRFVIVNNSIPDLLKEITLMPTLPKEIKQPAKAQEPEIHRSNIGVSIKHSDKIAFLSELNISENLIKRLRKKEKMKKKPVVEYKAPNFYGKLANKFFLKTSERWIEKGYFKSMSLSLRRSNLNILTTTYISIMILTVLLSFFAGIIIFIFFMIASFGLDFPYIEFYSGSYLARFIRTFWIVIATPIIAASLLYFFPSAEKSTLKKKIDQELPFVVIHMGSVSGSGIEPSEIFKIIGLSSEYKYAGKEFRKILNQINIYGYDLSTALRNVAMATPSSRLSELLNGISITINSGGNIKTFFEKRADSLLLEYRLEREKFTKTAETFMDIYISIVIAAPMILLMLLIMISVSGLQSGLSIGEMTTSIIGIVAIVNILFLTFLHLKQPSY